MFAELVYDTDRNKGNIHYGSEWMGTVVALVGYQGPYARFAKAGVDEGHSLGLAAGEEGFLCLTASQGDLGPYDRLLGLVGREVEIIGVFISMGPTCRWCRWRSPASRSSPSRALREEGDRLWAFREHAELRRGSEPPQGVSGRHAHIVDWRQVRRPYLFRR